MDFQPSVDIGAAKKIDGWMSEVELYWLAKQAKLANSIIEIGCYKGRSTRAICDNTKGLVIAVDPYWGAFYKDDNTVEYMSDDKIMNEFKENLKDHICDERLVHYRTAITGLSLDYKADFIFIDGDHRYNSVKFDILESRKRIKPGGILSGHDFGVEAWPGVRQAVIEIFKAINIIDTIWWIKC